MDSQRIYDICHWNWQKERVWGAKLDFFDQLIKATGRRWAHFSALNVAKTFLLMLTCTYTRWEHMTRTHIHVKIVAKLWLERRPWTISSWLGFRCDQCWYRPIVEHVTWWHKPSHYDLDLNWRCQCRWIYLLKLAFYVQLKLCCQGLWGFSGPLVLNILGFLERWAPEL